MRLAGTALSTAVKQIASNHINILGDTGFEHPANTLENSILPIIPGPKSGPVTTDHDLQAVIDRWSELPPPIRRQIAKLAHSGSLALAGVKNKIERTS